MISDVPKSDECLRSVEGCLGRGRAAQWCVGHGEPVGRARQGEGAEVQLQAADGSRGRFHGDLAAQAGRVREWVARRHYAEHTSVGPSSTHL